MIIFNANTEMFIERMAKNNSGSYIILGKEESGKTTILKEYLLSIPTDVRKLLISDYTETFDDISEKNNITRSSVVRQGGVAPTLENALRGRQRVIAIDAKRFLEDSKPSILEALEGLAMFSATNNSAITLPYGSFEEFIEHVDSMFESGEGSLTKVGFLKNIKGITLAEKVKVHNIEHRVQMNLMLDEKALAILSSSRPAGEKVEGLRILSKQQGNLSIEEQLSPTVGKGISKASQLVLRDFMENNTTGLVVAAGGAGSGKTSLLKGFIRDNHSRGLFGAVMAENTIEYQDLMIGTQACVGFSSSEEDEKFQIIAASNFPLDYIVFDEIHSAEELAYAIKLSDKYRVFIGLHASDHYQALERMTWLLKNKETLENLLPSIQVVFKINRKYDDQLVKVRFTSSPLILDNEIRKNIVTFSAFDGRSRAASKFVEEIVAEQGF